jgi:hypothetical protein
VLKGSLRFLSLRYRVLNDPDLSDFDPTRPTMCIDLECGSCSHDGTNCCQKAGENHGRPNALSLDSLGNTQCRVQNNYFAAYGGDLSGNFCVGADMHLFDVPVGCGCIPSSATSCQYDPQEQTADSKCFICSADNIIDGDVECSGCKDCLASCNSCAISVTLFNPAAVSSECCIGGSGDCEAGSAHDINTNAFCCFEQMDADDASCRGSCAAACAKASESRKESSTFVKTD